MTDFRTKNCKKWNHAELVLSLDSVSKLDPTSMIEFFENAVSQGQRFHDNETIQIGWMTSIIKKNSEGDLELWEPQFDSIPIKWIRGINNTLRHLLLQKTATQLFNLEPNFPSLRHAGIATQDFLKSECEFTMARITSSNNDSGWRFSGLNEDNNHGEMRSLFEIAFHQMLIVPFLALPENTKVIKKLKEITIIVGEKTVSSSDNNFLHHLIQSPILV